MAFEYFSEVYFFIIFHTETVNWCQKIKNALKINGYKMALGKNTIGHLSLLFILKKKKDQPLVIYNFIN